MRPLRSPDLFRAAGTALALLSAAFVAPVAHAQLYTWKDAQGNITIKNTPPPWYSESARPRGARVQVLRNGKVIDDTAWPAEKRQEGRSTDARQENKRAESERAPLPAKKEDDDE